MRQRFWENEVPHVIFVSPKFIHLNVEKRWATCSRLTTGFSPVHILRICETEVPCTVGQVLVFLLLRHRILGKWGTMCCRTTVCVPIIHNWECGKIRCHVLKADSFCPSNSHTGKGRGHMLKNDCFCPSDSYTENLEKWGAMCSRQLHVMGLSSNYVNERCKQHRRGV